MPRLVAEPSPDWLLKNVVAILKTPATHSEESVSPLTNSSRPTVTTAIADAVAHTPQITTAAAVNKIYGDIGFPISPCLLIREYC